MLYQLSYTRVPEAVDDPKHELTCRRLTSLPTYLSRRPAHDPRLHGGGRIRTYVGQSPADLQSATISHSVTPPTRARLRATLTRVHPHLRQNPAGK